MAEGEAMNDKMEFRGRFEGMTPEARMFALAELVYDTNIATVKIDQKLDGVCSQTNDHGKRLTTLETASGISNGKVVVTGASGGFIGAALTVLINWIISRGSS
ncbi:MAG: hypothetical protein WC455_16320 [Dehalococcoidia bacterium]